MPYTADTVPSHVPKSKANQWANVFNRVHDTESADGDSSRDEVEARAFAAANAILSTRSMTLKEGDFVTWLTEGGARKRGKIVRSVADELDVTKEGEQPTPTFEIQPFKPVRDGWEEADGDPVEVKQDDCTKIEVLNPPSRVPRKQAEDFPINEETLKAVISDAVQTALASIKASPPIDSPLRIKRLGGNRIGGYALVFGSDEKRDIEGDYFTKSTDLWLDVYNNQPIMFDHAVGVRWPEGSISEEDDPDLPRHYKLGRIVSAKPDDVGLWVEGVVEEHNKWVEGVWTLIDKGALFFSSGSVPHLIKRTEGGAVKSWPIIEVSLTPTPAEPRNTLVRSLSADSSNASGKSSLGMLGGSQRASARAADQADLDGLTQRNYRGGFNLMANMKRLRALIQGYYDQPMANAARAYRNAVIKATNAMKEGEPEEIAQTAEEAAVAATQLDELLSPISETAKSVLGLDPGEVRKALLKMAFSKEFGGAMPGAGEEEDFLEEGDPMMEGEGDFLESGEDMMAEDDYMEDGEFPAEDDEFAIDSEDELMEEPAMLSARSRRSGFATTRHTDIDRAVDRAMNRLPSDRRGAFKSGGSGLTIISRTKPSKTATLSGFIKAVAQRDRAALNTSQSRSQSSYKALGINPDTSGGFLVPPEHATEIIELLRNKSIFLRAEGNGDAPAESLVTVLPLNRDTMFIPRQTGASTAYWTGENSQITPSQQEVGQIQLIAKKLAVLVKVSNELLADSNQDVDAFIRKDIAKTMQLEVDRSVLYGTGINGQPLGIKNYPGVDASALNAVPTYDLLTGLISDVEEDNIDDDGTLRWLLNPRDKNAFRRLKDSEGQYIFAGDALTAAQNGVPRQLLGYDWITSNTIAKTGSPEETDVFFGKWSDVIIGMRQTIEVVASDTAGDSFEYDQTWIRAIMRVDVQMRHPESVKLLTDVRELTT